MAPNRSNGIQAPQQEGPFPSQRTPITHHCDGYLSPPGRNTKLSKAHPSRDSESTISQRNGCDINANNTPSGAPSGTANSRSRPTIHRPFSQQGSAHSESADEDKAAKPSLCHFRAASSSTYFPQQQKQQQHEHKATSYICDEELADGLEKLEDRWAIYGQSEYGKSQGGFLGRRQPGRRQSSAARR